MLDYNLWHKHTHNHVFYFINTCTLHSFASPEPGAPREFIVTNRGTTQVTLGWKEPKLSSEEGLNYTVRLIKTAEVFSGVALFDTGLGFFWCWTLHLESFFVFIVLGGWGVGGKPLYPFMACAFNTHDCFVAVFQVVCYCCWFLVLLYFLLVWAKLLSSKYMSKTTNCLNKHVFLILTNMWFWSLFYLGKVFRIKDLQSKFHSWRHQTST